MADSSSSMAVPSRSPLRWGGRVSRTIGGGALIIGGGVAVAGSNSNVLPLLAVGVVAHVAGWCVIPAGGWRRVVAAIMSTPAVLLLLAGPQFIGALTLPYLAWLLVRHRPLRSYPTVIFVLAGAVVVARLFPNYEGMLPALGIELAVLLASAWVARAVAVRRHTPDAAVPPSTPGSPGL